MNLIKLNLLIGFTAILFAASGGAFVANELTENFVNELIQQNHSWFVTMLRSAHGHTNLYGMLHILLGLTLNHSSCCAKTKKVQTGFMFCGTLAMSIGMLIQGFGAPSNSINVLTLVLGLGLALSVVSIVLHVFGILKKSNH